MGYWWQELGSCLGLATIFGALNLDGICVVCGWKAKVGYRVDGGGWVCLLKPVSWYVSQLGLEQLGLECFSCLRLLCS